MALVIIEIHVLSGQLVSRTLYRLDSGLLDLLLHTAKHLYIVGLSQ